MRANGREGMRNLEERGENFSVETRRLSHCNAKMMN